MESDHEGRYPMVSRWSCSAARVCITAWRSVTDRSTFLVTDRSTFLPLFGSDTAAPEGGSVHPVLTDPTRPPGRSPVRSNKDDDEEGVRGGAAQDSAHLVDVLVDAYLAVLLGSTTQIRSPGIVGDFSSISRNHRSVPAWRQGPAPRRTARPRVMSSAS